MLLLLLLTAHRLYAMSLLEGTGTAEPSGKTIQCSQTGEFNLLKVHYAM